MFHAPIYILIHAAAIVATAWSVTPDANNANNVTDPADFAAPETQHADEGFALVWADEFNTDGPPNPDNWSFEQGFKRNNEAQWYQPENARVQDGLLIIEARRETIENPDFKPGSRNWRQRRPHAEYTSASLHTRGKHSWQYGRFEMRARIDARPGLWPAWWTVGTPPVEGIGWPASGEIDMMEFYRGMILANAAWKKDGGNRWAAEWDAVKTPVEDLGEDWAEDFHVWRMDWTEDQITLSVDGRILNTIDVTKTINPDGTNPFRWPHTMLVNLAVGGSNGGDPSDTAFPAIYEIDWIRVFKRQGQSDNHANERANRP